MHAYEKHMYLDDDFMHTATCFGFYIKTLIGVVKT